ncbi:MAG: hypothetical protein FJ375_05530, partial [Pelagibacterales bacterium]|nr:hypothetical protein [Pelagibacterales bacterium]
MTFALKEIYIANEKNRDANVKFVSLIKEADPLYNFKNKPIKSRKILINSNETSDESLKNKYKDKIADKILKEDIDVDIEYAGKFIGDLDRIFLNAKSEILYSSPKIKDVFYNTKGEEIKKEDPKELIANIKNDSPPIKWTGKFFKREDVLKKFVITKSIQLKHVDGLTYEFLYDMAKTLDDKKSLVLLGAGNGKDPLIFQTNGT